jgi:tetratricopeptide (TPR) repeat protein
VRAIVFLFVILLFKGMPVNGQVVADTIPYTEGREFDIPLEVMDDEANRLYIEAIKFYDLGDLFTAGKVIAAAIKKNDHVPEYYLLKSNIEQRSSRYKKALKTVNKAVKIAPNSAAVYFSRAVCKYGMKDFVGAVQDYTKVIAIDPSHFQSFYGRGVAKSQLNEFNSAKEDFDVAIMLKPTFAKSYYGRGLALLKLQQYKEAMFNISSYTVADPNNGEAIFYLGQAKIGAGDIIGGCGEFAKAKVLGYKKAEEEAAKYCIR